ncbi:reverse transcriptase domain-containing protein [Geitlerinema splendidum]|nr:reverse transcriptase domain-containing protein [Geitlerinema splendidum]
MRRVTQNSGAKTPGVDGVLWRTSRQKIQAVNSLQRRGYNPQPLKRIYIPKRSGEKRLLSIPTMKCRAMQALHLLALEAIAEMKADKNAHGFRPKRSTADAIEQCFIVFARSHAASWALEGDIRSCIDSLSRAWLQDNMNTSKTSQDDRTEAKKVLKPPVNEKTLSAGV